MKTETKLKSIGLFTNLTNLAMIALTALGVSFGLTAEDTVQAFVSKNYDLIFSILVPSIISGGFKIYEAIRGKVNIIETIVKSPNFWNATITTILSLITILVPIVFPPDAGKEISEAFASTQLFMIISVVVSNIITPIIYYIKDKKKALTT